MSNARRTGLKNLYRQEFLRSPAWFARRDRWFRRHTCAGLVPCAACGIPDAACPSAKLSSPCVRYIARSTTIGWGAEMSADTSVDASCGMALTWMVVRLRGPRA